MHTMDKETAITEARQRFKAWRCRPDSCSVPPLNPQRTNFNFELIVSPYRFAIPFSGGYCIQLYKKLARCLIESATPVRLEIVQITKRRGVALWARCIRTCRNRNGMIRRYLPKRTPVAPSMARELQEIVDETDDRPMRVLG